MTDLPGYYILDEEGQPKRVDLMEWAFWFQTADRSVERFERDGYWVSTVFLGLDHNFSGNGPPMLFETMAFDDVREVREFNGRLYRMHGEAMLCERYSTRDNALIGHERHVRALNAKLDAARDLAASATAQITKDEPSR